MGSRWGEPLLASSANSVLPPAERRGRKGSSPSRSKSSISAIKGSSRSDPCAAGQIAWFLAGLHQVWLSAQLTLMCPPCNDQIGMFVMVRIASNA